MSLARQLLWPVLLSLMFWIVVGLVVWVVP